jgi:predicted HNH restriction endonuclease
VKEEILKLRKQGKTYSEIVAILGCSKSTVSFHCSPLGKQKTYKRTNASRNKRKKELKEAFGGCCSVCGYSRCLEALDFHHLEPSEKHVGISELLSMRSFGRAYEEAKKCKLVCSNCHREIHAGLITI